MAKSSIPNPLERRHLIEKEMDAPAAMAMAEAYLEVGRAVEAIDFLVKAEAMDRLEQLTEEAVASGDAFLVQMLARASGREPDAACWERVASAAEAAGKERYALTARRQISRGEG